MTVMKKEYKKPIVKVVELVNTDIICTSPGSPSPTSLWDEDADADYEAL